MFQGNKKRNRSTGGIGLGLPIVYGFVRKMNGFVTIESERKKGTTVRISIAQQIIDPNPCLSVKSDKFINIAFHVIPEKYTVSIVRDFYRNMATDMAAGLRLNLYSASTLRDLKRLVQTGNITHVFMGDYEYEAEPEYFDELADGDVTVAVSADPGFAVRAGSKVIIMPKPLYGYPVARILNGDGDAVQMAGGEFDRRPELDGLRALVVDDEPMNLVVATGLFKDYNMTVDTAESGRAAIEKYKENDYDIIFMDHMMPEMDGVEAMKHIRNLAADDDKKVIMIALTANAISGAREMFLQEGFDGFVSKPISIPEFERTMNRVISGRKGGRP
jgi:CheY-like chemotaxis protein